MSRLDQMTLLLTQTFAPTLLEIRDDSHKHAGHSGVAGSAGETHFYIHMESSIFRGLSRVECHRRVNTCLSPLFKEGLHAISLNLLTPP